MDSSESRLPLYLNQQEVLRNYSLMPQNYIPTAEHEDLLPIDAQDEYQQGLDAVNIQKNGLFTQVEPYSIQEKPGVQELAAGAKAAAAPASPGNLRASMQSAIDSQNVANKPEVLAAKMLQQNIQDIKGEMEDAEDDQGILGKSFNWGKNLFNTKNSSKSVNKYLGDLEKQGEQLYSLAKSSDTERFNELYQELSGQSFNQVSQEGDHTNNGLAEARDRVAGYRSSQEKGVETVTIVGAGLAAAAAAPFTGGLSLAGVAAAAGIGAGTSVALTGVEDISASDHSLNKGWKHYLSMAAQGGIAGAIAPVGGAVGGATTRAVSEAGVKAGLRQLVSKEGLQTIVSRSAWRNTVGNEFVSTAQGRLAGNIVAGSVDGGLSNSGSTFVKTGNVGESLKAGLVGGVMGGAAGGLGSAALSGRRFLKGGMENTRYGMQVGSDFQVHKLPGSGSAPWSWDSPLLVPVAATGRGVARATRATISGVSRATRATVSGVSRAAVATGRGLGRAARVTGRGIAWPFVMTGRGVVSATRATVSGVSRATIATGRGLGRATRATGRGIAWPFVMTGRGAVSVTNATVSGVSRFKNATGRVISDAWESRPHPIQTTRTRVSTAWESRPHPIESGRETVNNWFARMRRSAPASPSTGSSTPASPTTASGLASVPMPNITGSTVPRSAHIPPNVP